MVSFHEGIKLQKLERNKLCCVEYRILCLSAVVENLKLNILYRLTPREEIRSLVSKVRVLRVFKKKLGQKLRNKEFLVCATWHT
jgi:hypothetical protein